VIGAIAGGGKGAAIGTLAGGAAGTGAAAATGKKPAIVESEAILTFVTSSASVATAPPLASSSSNEASPTPAPPVPPPVDSTSGQDPATGSDNGAPLFSLRDQRTIRSCVNEHAADFPAGATQRPELPSGAERQIHRGGSLPSEIQEQAQSLPLACEEQLPKLPGDLERVVYGGRALLIDSKGHVLDMFYLDQNQ
jgi:hypothetical protein